MTKKENEKMKLIDELSNKEKFIKAQKLNGNNELLQTLIDDDCTLGIPNADGKLQEVSILAVLLENKSIVGILRDKLTQLSHINFNKSTNLS